MFINSLLVNLMKLFTEVNNLHMITFWVALFVTFGYILHCTKPIIRGGGSSLKVGGVEVLRRWGLGGGTAPSPENFGIFYLNMVCFHGL